MLFFNQHTISGSGEQRANPVQYVGMPTTQKVLKMWCLNPMNYGWERCCLGIGAYHSRPLKVIKQSDSYFQLTLLLLAFSWKMSSLERRHVRTCILLIQDLIKHLQHLNAQWWKVSIHVDTWFSLKCYLLPVNIYIFMCVKVVCIYCWDYQDYLHLYSCVLLILYIAFKKLLNHAYEIMQCNMHFLKKASQFCTEWKPEVLIKLSN